MANPTYSELQREYWHKRPANVLKFFTVEFHHPDFGYTRLVQNQYIDKVFDVDGSLETFQATVMDIPPVTNQSTDTTKAGTINFGRIGAQVRKKLSLITPIGAINYPIQAKIRQYEEGVTSPIYERRLFVNKNGININADNVSVNCLLIILQN